MKESNQPTYGWVCALKDAPIPGAHKKGSEENSSEPFCFKHQIAGYRPENVVPATFQQVFPASDYFLSFFLSFSFLDFWSFSPAVRGQLEQ
jgi:hypothetical protein